jgi:acyl-CoA synthetase (AMP-forming)/AMP-acid ligase II
MSPQLDTVKKLIENRDIVKTVLKGASSTALTKHRGILSKLLEVRAMENPNRVGLIFENGGYYPDDRLTYAMLDSNSKRMAWALREEGFGRGDKIAMVMRNHPEFIYALSACSMLGATLVPIDPRAKGEKLVYMLGDSDAKAVITTADLLPEVEAAMAEVSGLDKIYLSLKPDAEITLANRYRTTNEWLERREVYGIDDRVEQTSAPIQIIYTSRMCR